MRNVVRRDLTNLTFLETIRPHFYIFWHWNVRRGFLLHENNERLADSVSTFVSVRDMDELDFHNFAALHC